MKGGKQVCVRLNDDEYQALKRVPGVSDSERFRSLLETSSLTDEINQRFGERMDSVEFKLDMILKQLGSPDENPDASNYSDIEIHHIISLFDNDEQ